MGNRRQVELAFCRAKIGKRTVESAKVSKEVNSVFVTRDRVQTLIVYWDYCIITSSNISTISLQLEDTQFFEQTFLTVLILGEQKKET